VTPNWRLRVLNLMRGQAALDMFDVDAEALETGIEDLELVAVEIVVTASPESAGGGNINHQWFALTGDARVRYDAVALDDRPELLDATLGPGDSSAGYVAFVVQRGEGNLLLHFTPLATPLDSDRVYFASEPGARIEGRGDQIPAVNADAGATPEQPASIGDWVASGDMAVRVLDVLRGPEAEAFIASELEAGEAETPTGLEHVLIQLEAANIGAGPDFLRINSRAFALEGSPSATIDQQFTGPRLLDARLYPSGLSTGWLPLLVPHGETPLLVLQPSSDNDLRYMDID
jgi:hypothetical protein